MRSFFPPRYCQTHFNLYIFSFTYQRTFKFSYTLFAAISLFFVIFVPQELGPKFMGSIHIPPQSERHFFISTYSHSRVKELFLLSYKPFATLLFIFVILVLFFCPWGTETSVHSFDTTSVWAIDFHSYTFSLLLSYIK